MTRMHRAGMSSLLLGLLALMFGCGDVTGPETERVRGIIIGIQPDDPYIVAPDTVQAGEPFTVTVRTYGLNTCWRKGETEIDPGRATVLEPFDIKVMGADCADEIQQFEHTVTLTFEEEGEALIGILGRSRQGGGELVFFPLIVE